MGPRRATGRDVDDDSLAPLRHLLGCPQTAEEAPFEVHGVDAIPPFLVAVEEVPLGIGQPGVVDQHVDRAKAIQRLVEQAVDRRFVRNVGDDRDRRAPAIGDPLRHRFPTGGIDVADDDRRPFRAVALGDRAADAVRRPGDDRHLPVQPVRHVASNR